MIHMRIFMLLLAALATSCALPLDDWMENDFPGVVVEPAPSAIVGTWVGSNGFYLVSLRVTEDGNGLSCYSWHGKEHVGRTKYSQGAIVYAEGVSHRVLSVDSTKMIVRPLFRDSKDLTFYRDDDLDQASPYCQRALAEAH